MSMREKNYFLAPIGNPPEGPIRLGNIVSGPAFADDPINEEHLPLGSVAMEVSKHNQTNFAFDMSMSKDGFVGVWASFLQVLGIGGDVTFEWSREHSEKWACDNLKTVSCSPKLSYITQCLNDEGVKHYMRVKKPWLGASKLYMVTGIKVAYGAASTVAYARKSGLNLRFGTDFSSQGVPLSLGPKMGGGNIISVQQSQEGAEPFVFAFRLRRIKISRKGDVRHESYTRGTVLSIKEDNARSESDIEIVVDGIEDHDAEGSEFQLDSKDALEEESSDGARCKCVVVENT
ncbi:hypothetical protein QYS62_008174 [Fusarium acuminatum]|uniref:Uncharacterized protein n=1 Tax=Fusarium acuminatum TaxID=5515 RepID=A0ABZ2X2L2_9HYPO